LAGTCWADVLAEGICLFIYLPFFKKVVVFFVEGCGSGRVVCDDFCYQHKDMPSKRPILFFCFS
jgi:hypothetical protein